MTSEITEPQQQMSLASSGTLRRLARPAIVLIAALASRMLAAVVLQVYIQRARTGRLCVFPDTEYYWMLAQTIRHGRPYEIIEGATTSFRAMRTPGYPLFLAACQAIFGESTLAVRLVQAVLGAASVGMIFLLARRLDSSSRPRVVRGLSVRLPHSPPRPLQRLIPITWASPSCYCPRPCSFRLRSRASGAWLYFGVSMTSPNRSSPRVGC